MNQFRPLLSATLEDPLRLTWPVLVSPKLDGLRCIIRDGVALSRNLKPFRNKYVQEKLAGLPTGLDGELIVGASNRGNVLGRTQSGIMSTEGEPDFTFHMFDNFDQPDRAFKARHWALHDVRHPLVKVVPHLETHSLEAFIAYEKSVVDLGYEGVMIRGIYGRYKFGRATHNDGLLWKFKRFTDGEALVTGLEEGVSNTNDLQRDALGHAKRSSHQDGMVGAGRVGTILATNATTGQQLRVSPGEMTAEDRKFYWEHPEKLVGQMITIKYFEYGMVDQPRFCTFKAFTKELKMRKPYPALCRDCKHSRPETNSAWNLKCSHLVVNARDPWALSRAEANGGSDCRVERERLSWFAACGMSGKLWEPR